MTITLFILYCFSQSFSDGTFYHLADKTKLLLFTKERYNTHLPLVCIRGVAFTAIALIDYVSLLMFVVKIVSFSLMYSFIHNGGYNYIRYYLQYNTLKSDKLLWFNSSSTSTATLEIGGVKRSVMFVAGGLLYIYKNNILNLP